MEIAKINKAKNTNRSLFSRLKTIIRPEIVPFNEEAKTAGGGNGFHYKGNAYVHHSDLEHSQSAFFVLSGTQILVFAFLVAIILVSLFINWHATLVLLVALLTLLYFTDLLFNLFLIFKSLHKTPAITVTADEINAVKDADWGTYTVFCPLYKEWRVLPQFIKAMSNLDYPKDKLQVLLLLEEDDKETIDQVQQSSLPDYFDVVAVPHSYPKTKPKAMNYGLQSARGEYIVIFDAEDIPDTDQLKKAFVVFQKVDSKTVCVQAKLNFYNPYQNLLTRVFTAEYSLWFELVLTGLQSINAPIPLGGTSNHFRKADILKLKGWDAFNVTEDADLGMRLVKNGYKTAILDSTTLEEANSGLFNWFRQRTRWIKGYMHTYLVHMRKPKDFISDWRDPHVITFQLIVGGKVLSMLINPFMWVLTITYFAFRAQVGGTIESFFPAPVLYMGVFSFVFGNFLYMLYYMIGCERLNHDNIIKYVFLVPFYWLGMSLAAYISIFELIHRPHHWSKTNHGLHLKNEASAYTPPQPVKYNNEDFVIAPWHNFKRDDAI